MVPDPRPDAPASRQGHHTTTALVDQQHSLALISTAQAIASASPGSSSKRNESSKGRLTTAVSSKENRRLAVRYEGRYTSTVKSAANAGLGSVGYPLGLQTMRVLPMA